MFTMSQVAPQKPLPLYVIEHSQFGTRFNIRL